MTDDAFEAKIRETMTRIETLPESQRGPLLEIIEQTRERYRDIRDATTRAQNVLDDWRLIQKYRLFDAEARQREAASGSDDTDQ